MVRLLDIVAAQAAQRGAHASWELEPVETWRVLLAAAAGLAVLAWILSALRAGRRYRALCVLGEPERARVRAAITTAERTTSGELVVVVLERSDAHAAARGLAALAFALLAALVAAAWIVTLAPLVLLAILVAAFALGFALASLLPGLARAFLSDSRAQQCAAEQALVEFHAQGLAGTKERTGVLVFVSLLERRVIVLGDQGIHERVGDAHWARTRDLVLEGIARGRLCDGLVGAVEECGRVLAQQFPARADDTNELEDRLVVRRE